MVARGPMASRIERARCVLVWVTWPDGESPRSGGVEEGGGLGTKREAASGTNKVKGLVRT